MVGFNETSLCSFIFLVYSVKLSKPYISLK